MKRIAWETIYDLPASGSFNIALNTTVFSDLILSTTVLFGKLDGGLSDPSEGGNLF